MAAKVFEYTDPAWKTTELACPKCGWRGLFEEGHVEPYAELMDCSCPKCPWPDAPMLAIVNYPVTPPDRPLPSRDQPEDRGA